MRKTKYLLFSLIAIHLAVQTAVLSVAAQEDDEPSRWLRYRYNINSAYPYLKELPDWSKIPVLLEWINSDKDDAGVDLAYTQLVALSRVNFQHPLRPPAGELPKETLDYYRTERTRAWERWWKVVGQNYGESLRTRGRQNGEAWKLIVRDEAAPMPEYKIVIPEEWTLRTSYRAGDYDGIQTESLMLHRSKKTATLIRALRKSTRAALEWERWEPLTINQADNFAFAMAYAIDHPWLLERRNVTNGPRTVEGRNLTTYYPSFRFEFADTNGNVWWNDDPWIWHHRGHASMDNSLGAVCRLLSRTYPDDSFRSATAGREGRWTAAKTLDSAVLKLIAQDLVIRGEIIEAVQNSQRILDALETLAKFGTTAHVAAISEFETELPQRLTKVKAILKDDPNREFFRLQAEWLLDAAAKAKAAIQKRNKE